MYFSAGILMGKSLPTSRPLSCCLTSYMQRLSNKIGKDDGWLQKDTFASGIKLDVKRQSQGTVFWAAHMNNMLAIAVVNPCCGVIPRRVVCWFCKRIALENRKGSRNASNK